jgi:hypothetical protein
MHGRHSVGPDQQVQQLHVTVFRRSSRTMTIRTCRIGRVHSGGIHDGRVVSCGVVSEVEYRRFFRYPTG